MFIVLALFSKVSGTPVPTGAIPHRPTAGEAQAPGGTAAPGRSLAPTAPELQVVEARLGDLLARSEAVGAATSRLQTAWTRRKGPSSPEGSAPAACQDVVSLDLGWRAERFGAAWREVGQAVRVEAERLHAYRFAPTVAPLVEGAWGARLDALERAAARQSETFREAGAWQDRYVRPYLSQCPVPLTLPTAGEARHDVAVRAAGPDARAVVAVLGYGRGQICVGEERGLRAVPAEDGVVFVPVLDGAAQACWNPDATCTCTLTTVEPGEALGADIEESEAGPVPVAEPTGR